MIFDKNKFPNCHDGYQYALDIVSGKIRANKWVIGSCKRFLADLERIESDPECPFYFLPEKAEKFLRIVQQFEHPVGHWETQNIIYQPWQKFIWMNIKGFYWHATKKIRFRTAHIDVARGNAKAFCLETIIPTPYGPKRFGDIKIGDEVFNRNGEIVKVINQTPIHFPESYRIKMDRDVYFDCSDQHLWFCYDKLSRTNEARGRSNGQSLEKILTTKQMLDQGLKHGEETNFSIKVFKGKVDNKKTKLPVNPYFLGYWLGDGSASCARITVHKKDVDEVRSLLISRGLRLSETKYKKVKCNSCYFTVYDHHTLFREMNLINNKHIPKEYLSASYQDKIELIRGLFDSDGTITEKNNKGSVGFTSIYQHLVKDVVYILSSMGIKCNYKKFKMTSKFAGKNKFYYSIAFTPINFDNLFNLKRKKERQVSTARKFTQHNHFYIKDIKKIDKKPMKCIQVSSEDGSFLIGNNHVVTHNSTMASQAALYDLCCDNPNGNRIYCAATSRDQAKEVLNGSQIMARKNASFLKHFGVDVRAHEILHPNSNSYMKAISAQANSLDGKIGQLVITDELHAMQRKTFEVLDSGQSKRQDSLLLSITTAGYENSGIGASQRKYAQKVALGEVDDETFFSIVYCLDEDEHNLWDENNWIMANPNWGVSVDAGNFKAKAKKAQVNPEDQSNFKIKHLNIYLGSLHQYFSVPKFKSCRDVNLKFEDFYGENCYVGMDLSTKIDITSVCYCFYKNQKYHFFWKNYIPEERLNEVKNRNYYRYVEQGDLITTPGKVINMDIIESDIMQASVDYRFKELFFDPWSATQMALNLKKNSIEAVEFRMNTGNLSEPTKKMQEIMQDGSMSHNSQEMLEWCFGNVACKYDAVGNVFPRKEHEDFKIDPVISAVMALAGWVKDEIEESVYEERGMIFI